MSKKIISKKKAIEKKVVEKTIIKKLPDKLEDFKKGHDFEKKVALWAKKFFEANEIYTNILINGFAVKRPYEVDVHVIRKVGNILNRTDQDIWIECKNLNSTIKRSHVQTLNGKMEDVENACDEGREDFYFDKGAIASTSEFDSDAIRTADDKEIACFYYNKDTKKSN